MNIALSGKMRSGKSTIAEYLERLYGFSRFSLAAPLKDNLAMIGVAPEALYKRKTALSRELMQIYGQVMREQDPDHWVKLVMLDCLKEDAEASVIDDLRFENEAHQLRDAGFILVRVTCANRDEEDHGSDDISENDLDDWIDWDHEIMCNEGDLTSLMSQVDEIVRKEQSK